MENTKIAIKLDITDKIIEALAGLLLFVMWFWIAYYYPDLPSRIPTHFNFAGEANGFGDKIDIFILPVSATLVYLVTTILNKFPHKFNYPVALTEENKEKIYYLGTKMLRMLKFLTVLTMSVVAIANVNIAKNKEGAFPNIVLLILIGSIFISVAYFIAKMFMVSNKNS